MRKFLWMAAVAVVGLSSSAQANITPVLMSVTAEGDLFRYTYQVTLDSDQGLINGSKISIFDFAGFAGGLTTSNATFAAGTELFTAGQLTSPAFSDDPTVTNLTMMWTDGNYHSSSGPFPETNFTLTALSTFNQTRFDGYSSVAVKNNGASVGMRTDNVGPISVPFATSVPEPASWALLMVGFGRHGRHDPRPAATGELPPPPKLPAAGEAGPRARLARIGLWVRRRSGPECSGGRDSLPGRNPRTRRRRGRRGGASFIWPSGRGSRESCSFAWSRWFR